MAFKSKPERSLTVQERLIYEHYFSQQVLDVTRIIDGYTPFWLLKKMSGVVLGHRIYFRKNAYQPNTLNGIELLGHELTHVAQYMQGMNLLKYIWASRYGYRKNPYEIEAYQHSAIMKAACIADNHPQVSNFVLDENIAN